MGPVQASEGAYGQQQRIQNCRPPDLARRDCAVAQLLVYQQHAKWQVEEHPRSHSRRIGMLNQADHEVGQHGIDCHGESKSSEGALKRGTLLRNADANNRNPNHNADQRGQDPIYLGVWLEPEFQMRARPVYQEPRFLEIVKRDAYSEQDSRQFIGRGNHLIRSARPGRKGRLMRSLYVSSMWCSTKGMRNCGRVVLRDSEVDSVGSPENPV